MKRLLLGTLIGALLIIPALSFAGPIVPCAGVDCQGCHLVELGQNIIKFLIEIIAFMGAIVFAIGGLRMVMSKGNSGEVEAAKGMMTDVIVGLVILLAGWLIVDTILKMFVDQGKFIGPWYEIQCVAQPDMKEAPPVTPVTPVTPGTPGVVGVTAGKISSAALAYQGASTATGPDGGNKACAWAVNNVLVQAGIPAIDGSSVASMETALQGGRGTLITQASAGPGDIVIEAGSGHVGVCVNAGCSQVISNSSSKASFSWISGPDFAPSYTSGTGRIYRVN